MPDANVHDLSKLRINRAENQPEGRQRSRKGIFLFGIFALIVLAVVAFLFRDSFSPAVAVETYTVTAQSPAQSDAVLTASGYVVAQTKAAVASKGTGRIEYLGVEEGDLVRAGQIIAKLESNDVDAALEQEKARLELARARLLQAEAELKDAIANYERLKPLSQDQLVARSVFDTAQARFSNAEAAVVAEKAAIRSAEAAVRFAEVSVENTRIRAPFDGTVLTKNADVGEMVAPFGASTTARAAVVTIADMGSLEVEADVSESSIQRIQANQPCEIALDAYPDVRYPGYVSKIVPTADRAKATVLTKIKFKERDERVLPEMSAKVAFLTKASSEKVTTGANKIVAPASALATRNGQKVAFVINGESVVQSTVQTGDTLDGMVEVRSGLSQGQRIVLNPPDDMATGTRIKLPVK